MKAFHIVAKSYRDMKYVLADGIALNECLFEGDVFNTVERYARYNKDGKNAKIIWTRPAHMLVETVETEMKIVSIEFLNNQRPQFVEPGMGCRLILEGRDNIRSNDLLLIINDK